MLPPVIEDTLADAISSFVGLTCAEQKKTSNQNMLVNLISNCAGSGPSMLQDGVDLLYNQLYPGFVCNVSVTTGISFLEKLQGGVKESICTVTHGYAWSDIISRAIFF